MTQTKYLSSKILFKYRFFFYYWAFLKKCCGVESILFIFQMLWSRVPLNAKSKRKNATKIRSFSNDQKFYSSTEPLLKYITAVNVLK